MATSMELDALVEKVTAAPPRGTPYGLPLPDSERPNRTAVYRHYRYRDGPLLETIEPRLQTFHELFEEAARARPGSRCLGWRQWVPAARTWENKYSWLSYGEVAQRRANLGAGLVELHRRVGVTEDKYGVGLWAQNRPEWQITELAIISQSLFAVSLYDTLGPESSEYILNHASLTCVVASLPHIPTLLRLAPRCPSLKIVVSLDPLDAGEQDPFTKRAMLNQLAADHGIKVYSLTDVEKIGAESGRSMRPPHREDLLTINYTSGTTGDPKGVVLTHRNAVAAISNTRLSGRLFPGDMHISYLPLAHIYGRMADQSSLAMGVSIGYFRGDITGLVDDMQLLGPVNFFSVPRLYNRFQSKIKAATVDAEGFKGSLSRQVINTKKANMKLPAGQTTNKHFLYDRIWTPKVTKAVGMHKAKTMVSGSAQLDPEVQTFLRAAFGNTFIQGFGMTETYAVGTVQFKDDFSVGNIGAPCPCVEVCLESVPDMDYLVTDKPNPRGEMLMRGPIIFKEYFRNPEETQKTIESDGWFHTGDICEIDNMGRVKIIDRKKNVLKLAHGEYISPERLENVYLAQSNLFTIGYVHGDGKESSLVSVFGVDPETFAPFAAKILKTAVSPTDIEAVKTACADPRVRKAVMAKLDAIGKKAKFNSYERVRNVHLAVDPFTIDNDLMTPTLKIRRPQTAKAFRKEIDRMYAEIHAAESEKAKL